MIAIGLDFSKRDVSAFTAQMNRLINVLGTEPKVAVRMGAVALLTSLRASTKKAKKTATVRASKSARGRLVDGKRVFTVERYDRDGRLTRRAIFAASLAEAKQLMRTLIGHYTGGRRLASRRIFRELQEL